MYGDLADRVSSFPVKLMGAVIVKIGMGKIKDTNTFHAVSIEDFEKTLAGEILSGEHSVEYPTGYNTAHLICQTQLAGLEKFPEEHRKYLNNGHRWSLASNLACTAMRVAEGTRIFAGDGKTYQELVREILRRM